MASCCLCHNEFNGTPWQYDTASGERCHVNCATQPPPKVELKVGDVGSVPNFHAANTRAQQAVRKQRGLRRRRQPTQTTSRRDAERDRGGSRIVDADGNYPDMFWTKR